MRIHSTFSSLGWAWRNTPSPLTCESQTTRKKRRSEHGVLFCSGLFFLPLRNLFTFMKMQAIFSFLDWGGRGETNHFAFFFFYDNCGKHGSNNYDCSLPFLHHLCAWDQVCASHHRLPSLRSLLLSPAPFFLFLLFLFLSFSSSSLFCYSSFYYDCGEHSSNNHYRSLSFLHHLCSQTRSVSHHLPDLRSLLLSPALSSFSFPLLLFFFLTTIVGSMAQTITIVLFPFYIAYVLRPGLSVSIFFPSFFCSSSSCLLEFRPFLCLRLCSFSFFSHLFSSMARTQSDGERHRYERRQWRNSELGKCWVAFFHACAATTTCAGLVPANNVFISFVARSQPEINSLFTSSTGSCGVWYSRTDSIRGHSESVRSSSFLSTWYMFSGRLFISLSLFLFLSSWSSLRALSIKAFPFCFSDSPDNDDFPLPLPPAIRPTESDDFAIRWLFWFHNRFAFDSLGSSSLLAIRFLVFVWSWLVSFHSRSLFREWWFSLISRSTHFLRLCFAFHSFLVDVVFLFLLSFCFPVFLCFCLLCVYSFREWWFPFIGRFAYFLWLRFAFHSLLVDLRELGQSWN